MINGINYSSTVNSQLSTELGGIWEPWMTDSAIDPHIG